MITIKTEDEIALMRESGRLLAIVHDELAGIIKPGISTLDIDVFGENANFKDFSEVELKMLEYEKYSKTFETTGHIDFIFQDDLKDKLEKCQFGIGTPTATIEGNKITLKFDGGYENAAGEIIDDWTYTFEINPNYKCMDCYFVNYDRFLRKTLKNL